MKPNYDHAACDGCHFVADIPCKLGRKAERADLWLCAKQNTVILRYSDLDSGYQSFPLSVHCKGVVIVEKEEE